jgi:hypothetical protein
MQTTIARHDEVAEAYLVRKRTEHFDDTHPFFVLAVVPRSASRKARKQRETTSSRSRAASSASSLPHEVMVVRVGRESPLAERFAQVARARVFERARYYSS